MVTVMAPEMTAQDGCLIMDQEGTCLLQGPPERLSPQMSLSVPEHTT